MSLNPSITEFMASQSWRPLIRGWRFWRYDLQTVIGAAGGKIGFYGVTPITQPSGADQAAVTLANTDGAIGGLTISDPSTQAKVQELRDNCEELAEEVRALSTLVHPLRGE